MGPVLGKRGFKKEVRRLLRNAVLARRVTWMHLVLWLKNRQLSLWIRHSSTRSRVQRFRVNASAMHDSLCAIHLGETNWCRHPTCLELGNYCNLTRSNVTRGPEYLISWNIGDRFRAHFQKACWHLSSCLWSIEMLNFNRYDYQLQRNCKIGRQ